MVLKDISFDLPEENILYDELLLHLAEKGKLGNTLRFWESSAVFVVLGRISSLDEDVNQQAVRKDRVSVVRRCSGGGTVVQGKGCLNYSLILCKQDYPQVQDIRRSYNFILNKLVRAFHKLNVNTVWHPISDVACVGNNKKVSGNAQKRARNFILHHGTILCDFDLSIVAKYLTLPQQQPEYRQNRSHLDFLDNIYLDPADIKKELRESFFITEHLVTPTHVEREMLSEWLKNKKIRLM
ncbi:MAG: lipoate--protein ligase family protein [Candidatus Omnitrophica bacterium]|nr:lipoate--protein ligase family protein [Candidatus Omnitrophota bacterium]